MGGASLFFVVAVDRVNGVQNPSSGYHLVSKPLNIGNKVLADTAWSIPWSTGWVCTYWPAGAISNVPAAPDLRYFEGFGVSFKNWFQSARGHVRHFSHEHQLISDAPRVTHNLG